MPAEEYHATELHDALLAIAERWVVGEKIPAFNESKYTLKKFNCFLLSADFRKYEDQRENMINNSVIARIRNILIDHEMEIAHDLIKNKTKI